MPAREQHWFSRPDPILELVQARRRHTLRSVAGYPLLCGLGLLLLATAFLLLNALRQDKYPLAENAAVFAVIIVVVTGGYLGLRYLQQRNQLVYAGATWVGDGAGRDRQLTTRDLAEISVTDVPEPATLRITGRDNITLELPLGLVEGSPALWDLLYNGLRHSAAAGARVDPATRELLNLPAPR